jgi:hypothetical protein
VVKLIYSGSNFTSDMCVVFTTNYFLVGDDIFINSETLLVTDFVNFKIKLTQSFEGIRRGRICICIFIGVSAHTYINICVCIMFLKISKV